MSQNIVQVDAFTDTPFSGNPAAVCVLEDPADEIWMQNVAREMNLSETAFLYLEGDVFNLRWFGPAVEVDLCGHATLASAHVLWEDGHLREDEEVRFHTRSGLLTAMKDGRWINLNFPLEPPQAIEISPVLTEALGTEAIYAGANRIDILIEVDSEATLRNLKPDLKKLTAYSDRGFMVTSRSEGGKYDYVSRFFAPGRGVNEDPVTGSSQCCLGPYWQRKLCKDRFFAYQASARGGEFNIEMQADRVIIGGQAVTVMRGQLVV